MGLLGWLRRSTPKLDSTGLSEALIRETADYVVRMCEPRIALISRYRERLMPAVSAALVFVQKQRGLLGEPVDANLASWHSTPLLRAIFATTEDMQHALGRCTELTEWFDRNPLCNEVITTLGMAFSEQKVFGMAIQGDLVQRDVVQTTLSFSEHRARVFSATPESLWRGVGRRILDELALMALSRFETEQTSRKLLEEERSLLRARLRAFDRRGTGIDNLAAGGAHGNVEGRKLLHQLEENERRLTQMKGYEDLLELRLSILTEVLYNPENYLHIQQRTLHVDSMNRMVEAGSPDSNPIRFVSVRVERNPGQERALVALRVHRMAHEPVGLRLDDAVRLLG